MDNSIIVKNLPAGVYVPELCDLFRNFGCITSATVRADESKKSNFEAYIDFEDYLSAQEAVKRMNKYKIRNKPLAVLMSIENEHFKKVFVKNFSSSWDNCDLLKAFEHFGNIKDVEISAEKGKSNGYGFIIFEKYGAAKKAVERMNGKDFNGLKLQVERFKSKTERENLMQNSLEYVEEMLRKSVQLNNLHVKNIPSDMTDGEFKKLFERYGEISSAKIMTDESGSSKGFGFVSFTKKENAAKAMERLDGYNLKGKKLQINFKEDGQLRKQYASLKNKSRRLEIQQYRQRSQSAPKLIPRPLSYRVF